MPEGPDGGTPIVVRRLGRTDYRATWDAMRRFTDDRDPATPDEIWLTEHQAVYTLGLAGRSEHLLRPSRIEVIKVDRGGQVTYHGPGQLVVYALIDLRRSRLGIREMVRRLESAVVTWLAGHGIAAHGRVDAPGVYVDLAQVAAGGAPRGVKATDDAAIGQEATGHEARERTSGSASANAAFTRDEAKIAALGLKVRNHCTYHGLAVNVAMDLSPFADIDPCGYPGLAVVDLARLGVTCTVEEAGEELAPCLVGALTCQ